MLTVADYTAKKLVIVKGNNTYTVKLLSDLETSSTSTSETIALTPASLNNFAQTLVTGVARYSDTETYSVGDRCRHDFSLMECIVPIETAEEWNSEHWVEIPSIQAQIDEIKMDSKALAITVTASSLPITIENSEITSDMEVIKSELSNPFVQVGDISVATSNGSVTLSGTITGSTVISLWLMHSR